VLSARVAAAVLSLAAASTVPVVVAAPAGAAAPVLTAREVLGTSVQGRPIVLVHRTTDATVAAAAAGQPTRTVLVIGSIHGDEQAGLRVFRRLRDRDSLPVGLDLWLIRTLNPDGTAHDVRTNAHGVDLNRNFPYLWHHSPRGATWSGPRPLSEPESVLLHDLVLRLQPDLTLVFTSRCSGSAPATRECRWCGRWPPGCGCRWTSSTAAASATGLSPAG